MLSGVGASATAGRKMMSALGQQLLIELWQRVSAHGQLDYMLYFSFEVDSSLIPFCQCFLHVSPIIPRGLALTMTKPPTSNPRKVCLNRSVPWTVSPRGKIQFDGLSPTCFLICCNPAREQEIHLGGLLAIEESSTSRGPCLSPCIQRTEPVCLQKCNEVSVIVRTPMPMNPCANKTTLRKQSSIKIPSYHQQVTRRNCIQRPTQRVPDLGPLRFTLLGIRSITNPLINTENINASLSTFTADLKNPSRCHHKGPPWDAPRGGEQCVASAEWWAVPVERASQLFLEVCPVRGPANLAECTTDLDIACLPWLPPFGMPGHTPVS
ncbi:hypothetical protein AK812_SmicGene6206 [Symbiodinium microadriaticum]|uniref:Uncharacterized protein n=1 Tax=Symbiodinium microadriaticum TaxID=2951 RepID=A0A1Q9ERS2_SYMMI|nr:hypothetical protein AK812_SmicGene6206 [Symbiodinium microadriaticum]